MAHKVTARLQKDKYSQDQQHGGNALATFLDLKTSRCVTVIAKIK